MLNLKLENFGTSQTMVKVGQNFVLPNTKLTQTSY